MPRVTQAEARSLRAEFSRQRKHESLPYPTFADGYDVLIDRSADQVILGLFLDGKLIAIPLNRKEIKSIKGLFERCVHSMRNGVKSGPVHEMSCHGDRGKW